VLVRNKNVSRMGVDKTRQQPIPMTTLDEMRRASTLVDEANNVVDYHIRMIALALIARQFLRETPTGLVEPVTTS
jgi:limonene-1,2-epoxide hydrolase